MSIFLWVVMQRNVSRIIKNQYKSCLKSCQSIIHLHSLNHSIKLMSSKSFEFNRIEFHLDPLGKNPGRNWAPGLCLTNAGPLLVVPRRQRHATFASSSLKQPGGGCSSVWSEPVLRHIMGSKKHLRCGILKLTKSKQKKLY